MRCAAVVRGGGTVAWRVVAGLVGSETTRPPFALTEAVELTRSPSSVHPLRELLDRSRPLHAWRCRRAGERMWSLVSAPFAVYAFASARLDNTEPETLGRVSNSSDHALRFAAIRASERFRGRSALPALSGPLPRSAITNARARNARHDASRGRFGHAVTQRKDPPRLRGGP